MNQRKQPRLPVESLTLPFMATRESDQQTFQYLLTDTSPEGAGIVIPGWALAREHLNEGERVNLHLPFTLREKTMDQGEVRWARWREDLDAQACGVHLDRQSLAHYSVRISLEHGEVGLDLLGFDGAGSFVQRVLKDSCLLKRGVLIYLKHLTPYFSRVARRSRQDFGMLRDVLLVDAMERVAANHAGLSQLLAGLRGADDPDAWLADLDLEELRSRMESEFYLGLYEAALDSDLAAQYLRAIKTLEGRLYYNYNVVVMTYMRGFARG